MHLRRLELFGWRNYQQALVELGPGAHLLTGANGHGKTNLLEAVHYLAVGRSHRVTDDRALLRVGSAQALLRADVREGARTRRIELSLHGQQRNRARVDGSEQARVQDAIGHIKVVLFSPEDLILVRGDPSDRRRFLDDLLAQRRPAYRAARRDYERVLRQRNALLKDLRRRPDDESALSTWSSELVRLGARIVAARLMACAALDGPASARYADLVGHSESRLALTLERSTGHHDSLEPGSEPDIPQLADELADAIERRHDEERERGISLVGPHRDDVHIDLAGLPAKTHASQGEAWSVALALRLASRELLASELGDPITLLDDVFAQLDDDRRRRLAAWCEGCEQVVVSTAVAEDVPLPARRLHIVDGHIHPPTDRGDSL